MIVLSASTAAALALHAAEGSWIMFLQVMPPSGPGPVKIEGIAGKQLAGRLTSIAVDNAFDVQLIGLLPSILPDQQAHQIMLDFEQAHLHDGWFSPTDYVMMYIENSAQDALQQLLDLTHPGGLDIQSTVDIEQMAEILSLSVPTIRRMIKAEQIPYLKWRRAYRFVPDDVIASLTRNER